eukprot:TRINITY_DN9576_c0_g1_i2.p1 TRINITY_DN9576_c0_g1~~TRINITY_DN9576_c0_g1_i2.p1  ORF type:complete len:175 (+),score=16.08 TRINITY_DN9576_c0_g1_i2:44-568(+)
MALVDPRQTSREKAPDPTTVLRGCTSDVMALSFHPQRDLLASGNVEGSISLWSLATRRPERALYHHKSSILSLQWTSSHTLFSQGRDQKVMQWDINRGDEPIAQFDYDAVNFCQFSVLACSGGSSAKISVPFGDNSTICVFDTRQVDPTIRLRPPDPKKSLGISYRITQSFFSK